MSLLLILSGKPEGKQEGLWSSGNVNSTQERTAGTWKMPISIFEVDAAEFAWKIGYIHAETAFMNPPKCCMLH